jgi:hypothetical protein
MKLTTNTSKKVFLMVALLATVMGYANDGSFFISKKDAKKTVLTLNDAKVGDLFTIKDANALILYKETIKTSGIYIKGFNLTALPNGNYTFELDKDMEIKSIPFSVKDGKVDYNSTSSETVFKPSTHVKDNVIYVSKLSLNKAPLTIEVYRDQGDYLPYKLVYSEVLTANTKKFERVYKLEENSKGNYRIVYKTEGKSFTELL